MNGHCATRQRLWNLSPLGGARGDEWTWPGVTRQIAEFIATRGHPRGCYAWALVRPGRDYGIYRHPGAPEGML